MRANKRSILRSRRSDSAARFCKIVVKWRDTLEFFVELRTLPVMRPQLGVGGTNLTSPTAGSARNSIFSLLGASRRTWPYRRRAVTAVLGRFGTLTTTIEEPHADSVLKVCDRS